MTILELSILLLITAYIAGLVGSLTGLGGGMIVIPVLVLLFNIDIHYAMGASLISVIATSSGSSAAYLREGYTNLKVGMFLEVGAVLGAIVGAYLTAYLSVHVISIVFGIVMLFSAFFSLARKNEVSFDQPSHPWAVKLGLEGSYPSSRGIQAYKVQRVPLALGLMTTAGSLSGLLGIGSGAVKVLAMDLAMRLPYKVSTTTSNFLIGITAATSVGIYYKHGYIDPAITFPVLLGVLAGALTGARILSNTRSKNLRIIFSFVIAILAAEMMYKGLVGGGF